MPQDIASYSEFQSLISSQKVTVIDFYATWCGPCKMVAPMYNQLAQKYPAVQFAKVDVDKQRQIAAQCGIRAMPTFQIFQNGQKVDEVQGANISMLEQKINTVAASSFESFSGSGQSLGGGSGAGKAGSTYVNPWADSSDVDKRKKKEQPEKMDTSEDKNDDNDEMEDVDAELLKSVISKNKPKGKNYLKELKEKKSSEDAEGKGAAPSNMSEEEKLALLEKSVTASLLEQLTGMGFPKVRAIKSLIETGNAGVAQAVEWIEEHQNDDDVDKLPEFTVETDEEKQKRIEDQKQAVKMQLEENRRIRREEEKKERKEREKKRRMMGKNTQASLKKWEQEQREREKELQKKAKREEREARKKLKKQLKIDQLQRKLDRVEGRDPQEEERLKKEIAKLEGREYTSTSASSSTTTSTSPSSDSSEKKKSLDADECAVRIRLLDGSTITAKFHPEDPMSTVLKHAQQLQPGRYTLMTPFPRRTFTGNDLNISLKDAGLSPRGAVICTDGF